MWNVNITTSKCHLDMISLLYKKTFLLLFYSDTRRNCGAKSGWFRCKNRDFLNFSEEAVIWPYYRQYFFEIIKIMHPSKHENSEWNLAAEMKKTEIFFQKFSQQNCFDFRNFYTESSRILQYIFFMCAISIICCVLVSPANAFPNIIIR